MDDPEGKYYDDDGDLAVFLTFPQDMDQTVSPAAGSFTVERNDAPAAFGPPSWSDARTLHLTTVAPFAGTTRVDVSLDSEDASLRTLTGLIQTVFALEDIPDPPWWNAGWNGWLNDNPPPDHADPGYPNWRANYHAFLNARDRDHSHGGY